MTLLSICQDIARNSRVKVPSTIIGNTELEAVSLLQAITETVADLLKRIDWQELQAEATITTVASTAGYDLPTNFDRITNETAWNVTRKLPMLGTTSAKEWQNLKNATENGSTTVDFYRIRGSQILVYPTPSSVESLIYEYTQNTPVESSGGTAKAGWTVDTDVPRIDAFLVELGARWRFKRLLGKPYQEDLAQFNETALLKSGSDGGRRTITPRVRVSNGMKWAYPETVAAPL